MFFTEASPFLYFLSSRQAEISPTAFPCSYCRTFFIQFEYCLFSRLWDIENGACLRVLEGHEELVRCIRFDSKRIVSGAYDGKIKVWDLQAALNFRSLTGTLCIRTLVEHTGRVFRLQFDEFQIVSSSHDDTILIWDFLNGMSGDKSSPSRTYTYVSNF